MRRYLSLLSLALLTACASTTTPMPEAKNVGVSDLREPQLIKRVEPAYPEYLRAGRIQGTVVVAGTVPKEGGALRNARVVRSDNSLLDLPALEAVKSWLWSPGFQDGQPVDVEFTTTVSFSLKLK